MEKEFGIPTRVDNDVRTAALGELNYGAGVGCENLVCITVGTGIGSGLVINGKVVATGRMLSVEQIEKLIKERI